MIPDTAGPQHPVSSGVVLPEAPPMERGDSASGLSNALLNEKKKTSEPKLRGLCGTPSQARTVDTLIKSQVLYQLS